MIDRLPDAWGAWYVVWLAVGGTSLATSVALVAAMLRWDHLRYARRTVALLTVLGLLRLGTTAGMALRATRQLTFATQLEVDLSTDRNADGFPISDAGPQLPLRDCTLAAAYTGTSGLGEG